MEMYRLRNIDQVLGSRTEPTATPWLLNPSSIKLIYAAALKDFWWGLGRAGGMNLGMAIIGFSLPQHDDYARQVIYRVTRNYQEDDEILGQKKNPLVLVDFRQSDTEQISFKQRYAFVDWTKTQCLFEGFNRQTLRVLFPEGA